MNCPRCRSRSVLLYDEPDLYCLACSWRRWGRYPRLRCAAWPGRVDRREWWAEAARLAATGLRQEAIAQRLGTTQASVSRALARG